MAELILKTGVPVIIKIGREHFQVTLDAEPLVIGREVKDLPRKVLTLLDKDDYISRQHCQIWYEQSSDKFCCKNLSANGATLNSTLLKAGETSNVIFNKPIELLLGKTCLQIERQRAKPKKTVQVGTPGQNNSSVTNADKKAKKLQNKTVKTGRSKIKIAAVTALMLLFISAAVLVVSFLGESESKQLYARAVEIQLEQGMEQAITLYQEVVTRYPDSKYGQYAADTIRRYEEKLREQAEIARLAEEYAQNSGQKIMDKALGGQDLRVTITSWEYKEHSRRYEMQIEVFWNGAMIRSHEYNVNGKLTVDRDGSNSNFARTYANPRLQEWGEMMMWLDVAVALGELSSSPQ